MGCFSFVCGLGCGGMNQQNQIATIGVVVRIIRHKLNTNPLELVKTLEDLISFPSVDYTLHTSNPDGANPSNRAFAILISEKGDETHYVVHLGKHQDRSTRCLGYHPLTVWDEDAKLKKIE